MTIYTPYFCMYGSGQPCVYVRTCTHPAPKIKHQAKTIEHCPPQIPQKTWEDYVKINLFKNDFITATPHYTNQGRWYSLRTVYLYICTFHTQGWPEPYKYVYIHRISGDFQAKNTVCTPYVYGSGQPCTYSFPPPLSLTLLNTVVCYLIAYIDILS